MTCSEQRLVAFLDGELSDEAEREFDAHLLSCQSCWSEVQADRAGRLALEQLLEPSPHGLRGRVELAVALAEPRPDRIARLGPRVRRRRGALLLTAALLAAAAALGGSLAAVGAGSPVNDPPQLANVAAMLAAKTAPPQPLLSGERLVIDNQTLHVRAYMIGDHEAIVATSQRPFPMPARPHLLAGSSPRAWMASRGSVSMFGVNRWGRGSSMFVVAELPMAQLPAIAAHLHLI